MGALLSSHWPMSRHGPGGDVLGHRGPAFLQTVASHWPGEQKHSSFSVTKQHVTVWVIQPVVYQDGRQNGSTAAKLLQSLCCHNYCDDTNNTKELRQASAVVVLDQITGSKYPFKILQHKHWLNFNFSCVAPPNHSLLVGFQFNVKVKERRGFISRWCIANPELWREHEVEVTKL